MRPHPVLATNHLLHQVHGIGQIRVRMSSAKAKVGKDIGLDTAALLQKYLLNIGKVAPRREFISTIKFISFRNVLNLSNLTAQ